MKQSSKTDIIKATSLTAVVVGIVLSVFFIYQLFAINNEIDTKYVGGHMRGAATAMAELKSVAGGSLAEAYYQNHGQYLIGESKIYNASIITSMRQATNQSLIGFILSFGLVLYGVNSRLKVK